MTIGMYVCKKNLLGALGQALTRYFCQHYL